jgi:glycosyltransferase involved in cell wall biosynthesis
MSDQKPPPFISVLLPVYNGAKYLRQSIDSVLAQSYQEFELIIWDDCSTDSSTHIIGEYRDPRIRRYGNESNKGLFPTLNLAIREARGEWVRLWAQDDVMKPSCLQTEADFIARHSEIGMYTCTGDIIDETGKVVSLYRDQPYDPAPDIIPPALAAVIMIYHGPLGGNICFFGIRKSVFEEIGYFREDMICSGDFEMLTRLSKNHLTGFVREPLVYLRQHKGQASQQRDTHVASWREEKAIYDELFARVPDEFSRHARMFYFFTYAPMRMHYLIGRLIKRDFPNARAAYQTIRQQYSFAKDFLAWCLTGDRRLYRMKPKYRKGQVARS